MAASRKNRLLTPPEARLARYGIARRYATLCCSSVAGGTICGLCRNCRKSKPCGGRCNGRSSVARCGGSVQVRRRGVIVGPADPVALLVGSHPGHRTPRQAARPAGDPADRTARAFRARLCFPCRERVPTFRGRARVELWNSKARPSPYPLPCKERVAEGHSPGSHLDALTPPQCVIVHGGHDRALRLRSNVRGGVRKAIRRGSKGLRGGVRSPLPRHMDPRRRVHTGFS